MISLVSVKKSTITFNLKKDKAMYVIPWYDDFCNINS